MSALPAQHTYVITICWMSMEVYSNLERWKLFRCAILVAAFEVVFEVLDTRLDPMQNWGDSLLRILNLLVLASILFVVGVQENYKAAFVKQNHSIHAPLVANDIDASATLVLKAEIIPSVITEAAYEVVVEALHSLPDQIWNWEDLVKTSKGLLQCWRGFISLVLKNYKAWLTAQDFPTSIVLDPKVSELSAMFEAFESNVFKALEGLPADTPHRQDIINAATSLRHAFHLFFSRVPNDLKAGTLASQAKGFFLRICEVFRHPSRFAVIFLNFCSIVHSFWDGRQSGPDVILPMSNPTKRSSSRLSGLLVHHSRDRGDIPLSESSHPWTVAVMDLNAVPPETAEGRYSTGADIYGLTSMLFLLQTLNMLLSPSWIFFCYAFPRIIATWSFVSTLGDGTLSLLPPLEGHGIATPAYALLLDEEFSVVLRGTEPLVEAIALRGFHFSYPVADFLQVPVWKFGFNLILEGFFQGLSYLMAILPVWRLIRPSFTSPLSQVIGTPVLFNFFAMITSLGPLSQYASKQRDNGSLNGAVQYFAHVFAESVRSMARTVPIVVAWFLYIHEYTVFNELQLLVDLISPLCLAFIFSVPSRHYPVQTAKFLEILGNPPVKRWRFETPAGAATFQCLVICHDIQRRPVREINVRGVLDTLIPDERDVWRTWKARVADRIVHEEEISFARTLPTFRDAKPQKQLEAYLGEAQYAYIQYNEYRRWSSSAAVTFHDQATH